jgi:hypothetical protein
MTFDHVIGVYLSRGLMDFTPFLLPPGATLPFFFAIAALLFLAELTINHGQILHLIDK